MLQVQFRDVFRPAVETAGCVDQLDPHPLPTLFLSQAWERKRAPKAARQECDGVAQDVILRYYYRLISGR